NRGLQPVVRLTAVVAGGHLRLRGVVDLVVVLLFDIGELGVAALGQQRLGDLDTESVLHLIDRGVDFALVVLRAGLRGRLVGGLAFVACRLFGSRLVGAGAGGNRRSYAAGGGVGVQRGGVGFEGGGQCGNAFFETHGGHPFRL